MLGGCRGYKVIIIIIIIGMLVQNIFKGATVKKKVQWVKWDEIAKAKCKGSLGITKLQVIENWWWRIWEEYNTLW